MKKEDLKDLVETLAAIEHQRWADWQSYLHSLCYKNSNGELVIPITMVQQWQRQIDTPYLNLSEKEKDSDREQVDRYWPHIEAALKKKNEIIKQLTDGIKQWASEEDGVPEFLWDVYQKAMSSIEAKR